ncbi:LppA family lipoprotein [Nocardia jejuensis]|uniref:LppA family lipoprotein n=1 Tax=Nocardia jejuensis TaxID=328049 RepID=UPI0014712C53|nr:LppA family lipoprotein [Nocardia jejuensis]
MTALSIAVIATTTGCDEVDTPYKKTGPGETSDAEQKLRSLPALEETRAQLTQAVEELAAYASSLTPGLTWSWTRTDRQPRACDAPFDQTTGRQLALPNYIAQGGDTAHGGGISDEVWPAVRDKARELASGLGATENDPFPFEEKVGDREARFYGANGTVLWLSTRGISSNTGCRLLAAEKTSTSTAAPSSEAPR